jgi:hypothetical protein
MATATNALLGEIKLAGDLAGSDNGLAPELTTSGVTAGSYTLPSLTIDAKGRVTSATNVANSTLVSMIDIASATTYGLVKVGSGLTVSAGVISIPVASSTVRGTAKVDGTSITNTTGVLSINTNNLGKASFTNWGVIKVDNTTSGLNIDSAGLLSCGSIPIATNAILGVAKIGARIDVADGVISVPKATPSTYGGIKVGTGLAISSDGVLSLDIAGFAATSTTAGLVKLGSNIVNNAGLINIAVSTATSSALGLIKVGSGLAIDGGGVLSAPGAITPTIATTDTLGVVKLGSGIGYNAEGLISIPNATTASTGIVRIGTIGLSVNSSGLLSAKLATASEYGVVKSANQNDISISSGLISLGTNVARKSVQNIFTAAQAGTLVNLSSLSGAYTLNLAVGNLQKFTLVGNVSLANPSGAVAGGIYHLIVTQDSTGGRFIYLDTAFKLPGASLSIDLRPNKITVITLLALSTVSFLCSSVEGF